MKFHLNLLLVVLCSPSKTFCSPSSPIPVSLQLSRCVSVVLTFSECADAGTNLCFRLDIMLVQKKRPGPIGIFQASIAATSSGLGHRFDRRDAHHQELILASPFELNR